VQRLLEATMRVDQAFLNRLGGFPVRIDIRYEEIAPLRAQRMECLLEAAYRTLSAWRAEGGLRLALQSIYPRQELERIVRELLRLYALETRVLSGSVRLPALLMLVGERAAQHLFGVMNEVGPRLAAEVADAVYRPGRPVQRRSRPAVDR
jgi:hypothetical protein